MLGLTFQHQTLSCVYVCADEINLPRRVFFNQEGEKKKNHLSPLLIQKRFPQPADSLPNHDVRPEAKTAILR